MRRPAPNKSSTKTAPAPKKWTPPYKLTKDKGLGLVFIMDRLVKAQQTGCLYVVFFDIASRKVVRSERVCADAGGIGFRNYWFKPIKVAVEKLPKTYKQVASKK